MLSVKPGPFAVFTHLVIDPAGALTDETQFEGLVARLKSACRRLDSPNGWQPTLCVFLDTVWQNLFPNLRTCHDFELWRWQSRALRTRLTNALEDCRCPVKLIMADDLDQLVVMIPPVDGFALSRLLAGDSPTSLYDVPKLVKWLLQTANPDRPLATLDVDVLFSGKEEESELGNSLGTLLNAVTSAAGTGQAFILSGQYLERAKALRLLGPGVVGEDWALDALNGSPTRTALLSKRNQASGAIELQLDAVRAFFRSHTRLGLAPAFGGTISGAGQVMSSGCLDNPPWTHFRRNVLWCDDYLLRSFHVARGLIAPSSPAVEPSALFPKWRVLDSTSLTQREIDWHRENYIPTFLLGAVACTWTNRNIVSGLDRGTISANELWEFARDQLQRISREWSQPAYEGTFLAELMIAPWQSAFAPHGLRQAIDDFPMRYPASVPPQSLPRAMQNLIEDALLIPVARDYWKRLQGAVHALGLANWWKI